MGPFRVAPADSWPGGQLQAACPPAPTSWLGAPVTSEEAGAAQASGLAQVGRQGAAHVLGGGADALGGLDGSGQGLVELLQVLQVQLDGRPGHPGRSRGCCGGPLGGGWLGRASGGRSWRHVIPEGRGSCIHGPRRGLSGAPGLECTPF